MYGKLQELLKTELDSIDQQGLFKRERVILTEQSAEINTFVPITT